MLAAISYIEMRERGRREADGKEDRGRRQRREKERGGGGWMGRKTKEGGRTADGEED